LPGRDAIARRLSELLYVDVLGAPRHRGNRYFYARQFATKEKAVVFVKEGRGGGSGSSSIRTAGPRTAATRWGAGGRRGTARPSRTRCGTTLRRSVLYLLDVASGKRSEIDVIEGAKYAAASWTPKGDGFYYTWLPVDLSIPSPSARAGRRSNSTASARIPQGSRRRRQAG